MKILFIRAAPIDPNPRLDKEATALVEAKHNVSALGWDRDGKSAAHSDLHGYKISRFKFNAPYGSFKLLFYLIIWNLYEFYYLMRNDWDIVHSCCLDTAIPAYIATKIKRKKMVYDIYDFYSDSLPLGTPNSIRNIVSKLERFFIKHANQTIICDESRFNQIGIKSKKISVIMNTPREEIQHNFTKKEQDKKFTIFFAGILAKTRSLIEMAKAIEEINGAQFILAGFGESSKEMIPIFNKFKKTKFVGALKYEEVLKFSKNSDVLFAIYDPRVPNHKFSSANKLFEAMMCSKPIIVARGTSMDLIVKKEKCGIVIDYGDIGQLKNAILKLKNNPLLAKELGKNGRKAYDKKYNWEIMKRRLIKLYRSL